MSSTFRLMKMHSVLYLMMIPVVAYFAVFVYYPLYEGAISSFQEFNLLGARPFVGWENYTEVLGDPRFWQVLRNTLLIGGGILVVGFLPPIIIARAQVVLVRNRIGPMSNRASSSLTSPPRGESR